MCDLGPEQTVGPIPKANGVLYMPTKKTSDFQLPEDIRCVGGETDDQEPDGPLSATQQARVDALSPSQVAAADQALTSVAASQWQKVARLVAEVMTSNWPNKPSGIADVYYAQRVAKLVQEGILEAQGDLRRMRFSEVRLTVLNTSA